MVVAVASASNAPSSPSSTPAVGAARSGLGGFDVGRIRATARFELADRREVLFLFAFERLDPRGARLEQGR